MRTYVAIEGVDGSGKSTIVAALAEALRGDGHVVVTVREPGGTDLGEEIRRLLLHGDDMAPWTEAALFAAQRAQLVAEVVSPALAGGSIVVSDRSVYSSLAYQGGARGLGVGAVRAVNEPALGGVVPDLVVVLWLDPGQALARQSAVDRIGGQSRGFQHAVAEAYRSLVAAEPDRVRLVEGEAEVVDIVAQIVGMMR